MEACIYLQMAFQPLYTLSHFLATSTVVGLLLELRELGELLCVTLIML